MTRPPEPAYTVLIVDDDEAFLNDARDFLEHPDTALGAELRVLVSSRFEDAESMLADGVIDVLVLDVRDANDGAVDEEHGVRVFNSIKALQFLPIVFHTGMPATVERHAQPPLVQVVPKTAGVEGLAAAVQQAFASGLPALARGLARHVRNVTRDYLWEDVASQWDQLQGHRALDVAYQLTSRLARSLAATDAAPLVAGLQTTSPDSGEQQLAPGGWHAARMYVVPALGDPDGRPDTGELVVTGDDEWWLVLTPACDIANDKADWTQLARCLPLEQLAPVQKLIAATDGADSGVRGKVLNLLKNKEQRYFHLPAYLAIPDLVLDLQQVTSVPKGQMTQYRRRASLTPPYTQSVIARYTAYMGRVGLPDAPAEEFAEDLVRRRNLAASKVPN